MTTSKPLTDDELNAIEARASAATPAPWEIVLGSGDHLCTAIIAAEYEDGPHTVYIADCLTDYMLKECRVPPDHVPNMEFIAAARADVPRLIAEIRRQRAVLDQVDVDTQRIEAGVDRITNQGAMLLEALAHLDRIIAAYHTHPNIGPLTNTARAAAWWREHLPGDNHADRQA